MRHQASGQVPIGLSRYDHVIPVYQGAAWDRDARGGLGSLAGYDPPLYLDTVAYDRLNPVFTPRIYLVDAAGRVLAVQRHGEEPESFVRRTP